MSRNIPTDRALSPEDREYLVSRANHELIAVLDEQYGDHIVPADSSATPAEMGALEQRWLDGEDANKFKVAELQSLASARELDTDGKKADLIARLHKYDADQDQS